MSKIGMNRIVIRKEYRDGRDAMIAGWYWIVSPGFNERRWHIFERAIYYATTGRSPNARRIR